MSEKTTSAREKLKRYNAENDGDQTLSLKKTGIEVTLPKVIKHKDMMASQVKARGKSQKIQSIVIADLCRFEGERWTIDLIDELPSSDVAQLVALLFGDAIGDAMDKLMGDQTSSEEDVAA